MRCHLVQGALVVGAVMLASFPPRLVALDNGFVKPALGWSSWCGRAALAVSVVLEFCPTLAAAQGSSLVGRYAAPMGSQVTDAFVRASTQALISSGLAQKGYKYVNVDEGWLKGRHPDNKTIYEDRSKFPQGMKTLGDWITAQSVSSGSDEKMVYGLYSCRGTCQCGTRAYHGPGSHGYEAADTQWMIDAGARWLKIDSCCGSQNHSVAFSDYAKFRDAMNNSGKQVWFNLCGWNEWYAPPDPALNFGGGKTLGNSFRISGDGGSWGAITKALNVMADVVNYTVPGGYPDPDNILGPHGTVGRVSESQARVQMVLWSIMPTQLILGEDVTKMSDEYIDTVGNEELIRINQDSPFVGGAKRIVGGDLTFPCGSPAPPLGATAAVVAEACIGNDDSAPDNQEFFFNTTDNTLRLAGKSNLLIATSTCEFEKDGVIVSLYDEFSSSHSGGESCGGANWTYNSATGQIIGADHKCLDEYEFTTPRVDLWQCQAGATNEAWAFEPSSVSTRHAMLGNFTAGRLKNRRSGKCLTAQFFGVEDNTACENIWSRKLSNGDVALAMVNQGENATVVCDSACFAVAGLGNAQTVKVRDLIAHTDLPDLRAPLNLKVRVPGKGSAAAFRLTPTV